jgi:hypothetical protein
MWTISGNIENLALQLVLDTGLANQPAVRFLAGSSVQSCSLQSQKPKPLCLGGVVTRTGLKRCVFWLGKNLTMGPFWGSYIFGFIYVF